MVAALIPDACSEQAVNDVRQASYELWHAVYSAIDGRLAGRDAIAAKAAVNELSMTGRIDDLVGLAERLGLADALVRTRHGIYRSRLAHVESVTRALPAVASPRPVAAREPWITSEKVEWTEGCVQHAVIRHRFRGRPIGRWS